MTHGMKCGRTIFEKLVCQPPLRAAVFTHLIPLWSPRILQTLLLPYPPQVADMGTCWKDWQRMPCLTLCVLSQYPKNWNQFTHWYQLQKVVRRLYLQTFLFYPLWSYSFYSIHYDPILPILSNMILFYPLWSYSIHYDPVLSIMILFYPSWSCSIHHDPILSTVILFYPLWSYSIHYDPVLSITILFYPLWSCSIHYDPILSIMILFYPLLSHSIHCDPILSIMILFNYTSIGGDASNNVLISILTEGRTNFLHFILSAFTKTSSARFKLSFS